MIVEPRYSIIIPAHNEEHRIHAMLGSYVEHFPDAEILVVLNGCTDDTKRIVEEMQAEAENLSIVDIEEAVGKGGAVRVGLMLARAPIAGYVDADGATPPAELRRIFEELGEFDGVIASRWAKDSVVEVAQPWARRVTSRTFNLLVRLMFGLPFSDTQCGAKAFRTDVIRDVLPIVETSNFAFDVDFLLALKQKGARVREIPTVWKDIEGSRLSIGSSSAKMFAAMLRLRIRHSFFRIVVPAFDRLFPTKPIRAHENFRILFLNWRDPEHPQAGGAEKFLYEIGKRLVEMGHHVEWLTASFPGAAKSTTMGGMRVTRVGSAVSVYFKLPVEYLKNFRDRFDVIIDAENGIPFFSPLYSLKPKICVMHHVHKDVFRKHLPPVVSHLFTWLECWVLPRLYAGARFVAVSKDTKDEMLSSGFEHNSIGLVYNGIDPGLHPDAKTTFPSILYLGRLKPYKRLDLLLEAFAKVVASVPDARLILAGTGDSLDGLRGLARRLAIEDRVQFTGFVDEQTKQRLLAGAWVFASPSEKEGWGISALEANACGTPVVAFNVSGLREAVVHGHNGLLVDEGSDLAEPLCAILSRPDLRHELSIGAIERAREFSWDRSAELFLEEVKHAVTRSSLSIVRRGDRWELLSPSPDRRNTIGFENHKNRGAEINVSGRLERKREDSPSAV